MVSTSAAYHAVAHDTALWLPAVQVVAERHRLTGELRRPDNGSNVVFHVGEACVVNLFAPIFAGEHRTERALLAHVAGRLPVATPEILADGELEGWPYLVLSRIAGAPLV